jgi:hypothetical protein
MVMPPRTHGGVAIGDGDGDEGGDAIVPEDEGEGEDAEDDGDSDDEEASAGLQLHGGGSGGGGGALAPYAADEDLSVNVASVALTRLVRLGTVASEEGGAAMDDAEGPRPPLSLHAMAAAFDSAVAATGAAELANALADGAALTPPPPPPLAALRALADRLTSSDPAHWLSAHEFLVASDTFLPSLLALLRDGKRACRRLCLQRPQFCSRV